MALQRVPLTIIVSGAVAVSTGVAAAVTGGIKMKCAKRANRLQAERYDDRYTAHQATTARTNEYLQALGSTQVRAHHEVTLRMREFLERNAKQVRANEHLILDGVDDSNAHVVGLSKLDADVAGWVHGVIAAVSAGRAAPGVAKEVAVKLARASTGTKIASLHGAAAEKATLAYFGGGSIKSGGGGMKLGGRMLHIVMIAPVALIAGLTVLGEGFNAKASAEEFQAQVDREVARLDVRDEILRGVQLRAKELDRILVRMIDNATDALDLLESEEFIMPDHAELLQSALVLQRGVRDVAVAPIADENGEVDKSTDDLIFRYRERDTETPNA